ncbi:MAG: hypothetical protein IPJ62_16765 [Betaproteobacteria bacterium]|nr:hypothetical protein [Betaproteobacteria bacterium]
MSKHVKTIVAAATEILSWEAASHTVHAEGKALAEKYAAWPLDARQKIDELLVRAYADMAGVQVTQREKAGKMPYCLLVAQWKKDAKGIITNPEAMRLSRVRGILFATEKAEHAPQKRSGKGSTAPKAVSITIDNVLQFAEKRLALLPKEPISKTERAAIRQAMSLLASLLG